MARKPRGLSKDEKELWEEVAKKTAKLRPDAPKPSAFETEKQTLSHPKMPKVPTPRFQIGERAKGRKPGHDLAPSIRDQVAGGPIAMDKKRYGKMTRGRIDPEARIDLHGLTMAEAHPRLNRFILNAVADQKRLVLVITGKGKSKPDSGPIPERLGVLRHQVPHWLHMPPLRAHVLQISEANQKHGGHGAYYVYLRRAR